ncbi:MAG TPA: DoxX-like family protein [Chthoniobacterales bacterium]|nr:DoxX-like family protein [Chthoniobacterales bacterium]
MNARIWFIKVSARNALGIVWLYEGLVPKLLFVRPDEIDLVQRSGIWWGNPLLTLQLMGLAQIAVGFWLLTGWRERMSVTVATLWMCALIVLVATGNPWMLTDPYGALIKDVCLIACAITVWLLGDLGSTESIRSAPRARLRVPYFT